MPGKLTALLFPGQGSQTSDMRETVEVMRPDLLELAIAELGEDPFERLEEGTLFLQPALYCASIALWERLRPLRPDYVAGHSLGEVAALVAAGSLSPDDGLRIVALRGRLMQEAAERAGEGGMLALLGGDTQAAEAVAAEAGVAVANDNAPGQVVLSGSRSGLERAAAEAKASGMKAFPLAVQGAFHSAAMTTAVPEFRAALEGFDFAPPKVPVISSVTARPVDDIRARLAEGLTNPVRWREALLHLRSLGVSRFVETGPGRVLRGLVRRTLSDVEALTGGELEVAAAHA